MSELIRESKQRLLDQLQVELEATRRKEAYLASYVLDLTCEIRNIDFARAEANGELPYQRGHENGER